VTLAMGFARVESTHFSWNILFDCDIRGFYLASRALGLNTHLSRCEFTAVLKQPKRKPPRRNNSVGKCECYITPSYGGVISF
jgi:hypothetical protein